VSEEYPLDRGLPTKSSRNPIELVIAGVLTIAVIAAVVLSIIVLIKVNDACAFHLTNSIPLRLHCTIFSYAIRFLDSSTTVAGQSATTQSQTATTQPPSKILQLKWPTFCSSRSYL
jgi:hypothetical protein